MKLLICGAILAGASCAGAGDDLQTFSCRDVFTCAAGDESVGNSDAAQDDAHDVDADSQEKAEIASCGGAAQPDPRELDCVSGSEHHEAACTATCSGN